MANGSMLQSVPSEKVVADGESKLLFVSRGSSQDVVPLAQQADLCGVDTQVPATDLPLLAAAPSSAQHQQGSTHLYSKQIGSGQEQQCPSLIKVRVCVSTNCPTSCARHCIVLPCSARALLEHQQGLVPGSLFLIGNAEASKLGTITQHALSPVSQELSNFARDG